MTHLLDVLASHHAHVSMNTANIFNLALRSHIKEILVWNKSFYLIIMGWIPKLTINLTTFEPAAFCKNDLLLCITVTDFVWTWGFFDSHQFLQLSTSCNLLFVIVKPDIRYVKQQNLTPVPLITISIVQCTIFLVSFQTSLINSSRAISLFPSPVYLLQILFDSEN